MRNPSTPLFTLALVLTAGCRPDASVPPVGASASDPPGANAPDPQAPTRSPSIEPANQPPLATSEMLAEVDPAKLQASVERLAAFGTRHTLSTADDPARGIGAARTWIHDTLASSAVARNHGGPLEVAFDAHKLRPDKRRVDVPIDLVNVVATLPGAMPEAANRHYYVVAHYDSRASDPMDRTSDAPGANDDGSGVALVLELARIMAAHPFDATIVFMTTAGEEQGLLGARHHATALASNKVDVRGVLNNDIVGDPTDPAGASHGDTVRVFSPALPAALTAAQLEAVRRYNGWNDSAARQLARFVSDVAHWHDLPVQPSLVFRPDRFLRGGDHLAFNALGFPAVRFTELVENYDRQHQNVRSEDGRSYGDLPELVDAQYLAGVAQINLAALAHLANAPSVPSGVHIDAQGLALDTTLRWDACPEPDVAGYEVVWRATTAPMWEHHRDVGRVTTITVPVSKDDHLFGVRAYDAEGYRSPVAFATLEPARP